MGTQVRVGRGGLLNKVTFHPIHTISNIPTVCWGSALSAGSISEQKTKNSFLQEVCVLEVGGRDRWYMSTF